LDNLHITADGTIILYDFDSGGFGWRASDLQGWAIDHPDYAARWEAFHLGYTHARPLREVDLLAAPYLTLAWDIWALKVELERRVLAWGVERRAEFIHTQLEELRSRSRQYGLSS
jgi:Ser/Thr protein kinase RdoA (MazF antagonist)